MAEDRKSSLLTNTQRKHLTGEDPASRPGQTEGRIRERVIDGILDFHILFEHLDEKELREIFGSHVAPKIEKDNSRVNEALQDDLENINDIQESAAEDVESIQKTPPTAASVPAAIAFFLRGLNFGDEQIYEGFEEMGESQPAFRMFNEKLEEGIHQYLFEEQNYMADVSVTIELDNLRPIDELLEEDDGER